MVKHTKTRHITHYSDKPQQLSFKIHRSALSRFGTSEIQSGRSTRFTFDPDTAQFYNTIQRYNAWVQHTRPDAWHPNITAGRLRNFVLARSVANSNYRVRTDRMVSPADM